MTTLPTDTRRKSVLLARARNWEIASGGVGIYPAGDAQLLITHPDFTRAGDGMAGIVDLYDAPMELALETIRWGITNNGKFAERMEASAYRLLSIENGIVEALDGLLLDMQ